MNISIIYMLLKIVIGFYDGISYRSTFDLYIPGRYIHWNIHLRGINGVSYKGCGFYIWHNLLHYKGSALLYHEGK